MGFEARHPQDGPHCDLRFRLQESEFVIEIAMNLVFLDWMLDVGREDSERIDESEVRFLAPKLQAYFVQQMPVRIDGFTVVPLIRKVELNSPDEVLLPLFPLSGWRGLRKISFELAYPLKEKPNEVALAWPVYPPDLLSPLASKPPLEIAAEWTADGLRSQLLFTRAEPGYTWHRPGEGIAARLEAVPTPPAPRPLVPPWATIAFVSFTAAFLVAALTRCTPRVSLATGLAAALIVLVIRPSGPAFLSLGTRPSLPPDEVEAQQTFEALHANLYRAFDYDSESAVYDALAASVDGALLEETYLGVRRALVMEEEGGAMSRVVTVRPISTRVVSHGEIVVGETSVPAFVIEASWQVDGRVTHWGHAHNRTNEYDGRFVVAANSDGWRIHDAEITRQERVERPTDAPTPTSSEPSIDPSPSLDDEL